MSIRELARRVGRDVQAVHRDVTTLINSGVIERSDKGIEFPYENIHFEWSEDGKLLLVRIVTRGRE